MPFVWKEKYRLGISEIDRQHQTFLLMLNKAYDFYSRTLGQLPQPEMRRRVLQDLQSICDFAKGHFATEEAMMAKYGYPKMADHQQEHKKFLDIAMFLEDKTTLSEDFSSTEWIQVILGWYDHHVQHIDRELGEFLQASLER